MSRTELQKKPLKKSKLATSLWGIDLFSGAGGMSLGAELAGIEVKIATDIDSHAANTYKHNFPKTTFLHKDIRDLRKEDFPSKERPYVVFGGAPCQGFSTSNQRTRSVSNENNWLYEEFVRLIRINRPSWVVFENVKGFVETEGGQFLVSLVNSLKRIGYKVDYSTLNSSNFLIPQDRTRLFVIGRLEREFIFPPQKEASKKISLNEALGDLPSLENGASIDFLRYPREPLSTYAKELRNELDMCGNHLVTNSSEHIVKRYKTVPEGGNWEDIPENLMKNYRDRTRCHTGIYHRLRHDTPSVVIGNYRKNMLIHPFEDRGLSVREAARIQSFPDSFYFTGSIGFQQQQVANAVPPRLAKEVFEIIMKEDGLVKN